MQVCLGYKCMYTFSTDSLLCLSTKGTVTKTTVSDGWRWLQLHITFIPKCSLTICLTTLMHIVYKLMWNKFWFIVELNMQTCFYFSEQKYVQHSPKLQRKKGMRQYQSGSSHVKITSIGVPHPHTMEMGLSFGPSLKHLWVMLWISTQT